MANGVDTGTGAFTMESTVFSVDGGRSIPITLRYNSLLGQGAEHFSPGWAHDYEAFISGNPASVVNVNLDSTRRIRFQASGGNYTAIDEAGRYDKLQRIGNAFTLTRRDGTIYEFDVDNRLKRLGNKVKQYLEFRYNDFDELIEIKEPIANRVLAVQPRRNGSGSIQFITDQEDRIVYFGYDDAGRLTSIHPAATLTPLGNTSFISTSIPDGSTTGVTRNIVVNDTAPIGLVAFGTGSIAHPRPADLRVSVTSPRGTTVNLTFANNEAPNIRLPAIAMDQFNGENPQGTWRVAVRDVVSGSSGSFEVITLRFTERTDPTRFQYGVGGRMVAAFDPDDKRLFSIAYDSEGRVFEQEDGIETNLPARFQYVENQQGLRTFYTDRLGNSSEFHHDTGHHLTMAIDPLNRATEFTYDAGGNRSSLKDPLGRVTRFLYDANGDLTQVADPASNAYTMTYDSNHNLLSFRDPNGNRSSFTYDNLNNLRAVTDALGNRDTKTYNSNSKLTGSLMADGAGMGFTYSSGMPSGASHPETGANAGAGYDLTGRVTSLKDADGFETKITYDSQGREVRKENPLGNFEESVYDRRGRLISSRDFNGNRTTFTYDNNDNVLSVRDALGRSVSYEYDGEDRMVKTIVPGGATARIVYDKAGQVIEEADPLGNASRYKYDLAGNRTERFDANGDLVDKIAYNALDLPERSEDADGNVVVFEYDDSGRPTAIVNPLGRRIEFGYDEIDRPTSFRDPLNRSTRREFEKDDVVSRLIDAKDGRSRFTYDQANRLIGVELPFGFINLRYNNRDLMTQYRTPTGRNFNYVYDAAGQVQSITPSGTNSANARTLRYELDGNGNLLKIREQNPGQATKETNRDFDALDRVTRYTDSEGNTLRYRYDEIGNLAELTYPDGKQVFYSYDQANRLTELRDWDGRRTRYHYDGNSRLTRIEFPNGTRRVMAYDASGRVLRRQDRSASGAVIVDYRYSYNADGKLGVTSAGGMDLAVQGTSATFSYNNANRIVAYNGQNVSYNQDGQLTRGPLGANFQNFTYDFNGNLTQAGDTEMLYNSEDRLIGIRRGSALTRLVVNPLKEVSQVLMKRDPDGNVTRYVWGIGLAYEVSDGEGLRVYHFDDRGSVTAFTNTQGAVNGRIAYTPYGDVARRSGSSESLYQFQGLFGVLSAPNGLVMMGLRWYSPQMRRFLTEDPYFGQIEKPGSLNRYAYAGADPINRFDPSGKFWNLIAAAVGAVVGVVVQGVSDIVKGEFSGWEAYAGAAIGGAVAGFIVSSTGCVTCAGAAGSATEYLVTQGLKGEPVDPVALLVTAGLGAAFGKIGDKAGKVLGAGAKRASQGLSKALGRQAARPLAQRFSRRALKEALKREATKVKIEKVLGEIPEEFATGIAEDFTREVIFSSASASPGASRRAATPEAGRQGLQRLNRGRNQSYGEFVHWKYYLESLRLAAVPAPNNPNNLLTSF
ncbi:MAG: RHS repeat-associated core domain-containing protein [Bryobacterales bacterium]|nr:RHS repeat-associated core domain-containing protein [Bryobacterales bacterium]